MYAIRSYYAAYVSNAIKNKNTLDFRAEENLKEVYNINIEKASLAIEINKEEKFVLVRKESTVITSYSIHYTKLYEDARSSLH